MARLLFSLLLSLLASSLAWAYGQDKAPEAQLQALYPDHQLSFSEQPLPAWKLTGAEELLAFTTQAIAPIPAYSGKPIDVLVVLDSQGSIKSARVLEHHEPILLVGIPEAKLHAFTDQYQGLAIKDAIRVGSAGSADTVTIDGVTGATVTVMVVNQTIIRAAREVARAYGLDAGLSSDLGPVRALKADLTATGDWTRLSGDGSLRSLLLDRGQVDDAFVGTAAADVDAASPSQRAEPFIELWFAPLNVPAIGLSLLGQDQYQWLMGELNQGDQAIAVMASGRYSFRGNGFVRGGIFDRVRLWQDGREIAFRDMDYHRLSDVFIDGFPGFDEKAIFIARGDGELRLDRPWQLELMVRRQVGALKSEFVSFYGDYQLPESYLEPAPEAALAEERPLWVSVWYEKRFQIAVLGLGLLTLLVILILQDQLVQHPNLLHKVRLGYLLFTLLFIGWYSLGQLSIVNVFTFLQALMGDFQWQMFLLDPVIFILWAFVAMTLLLWGRGIFCGWLCPFGALQELINEAARKLKIKQVELPFAVHERLWALKYIILLGLFGLSLESLATAERFAEVEPFKTSIMLKFDRQWWFVLYAALWLLLSIFNRKTYCRYICPLGAALAVPARNRLFDWLKRRKDCGTPCQLCAKECEIQAIHPDGHINANECHYCLDCQITYHNKRKCPPLVMKEKQRRKGHQGRKPPMGEAIAIVEK
ncbi:4Fe-4S binding protein [Gallaecimonas sp. GXIMD4217]|uniref:transcriptional regulator NosR n=1 Tax=Gallaecimonas sp. GXIMD4217 TaxID=3131927 RepID=UPI00311AE5D8